MEWLWMARNWLRLRVFMDWSTKSDRRFSWRNCQRRSSLIEGYSRLKWCRMKLTAREKGIDSWMSMTSKGRWRDQTGARTQKGSAQVSALGFRRDPGLQKCPKARTGNERLAVFIFHQSKSFYTIRHRMNNIIINWKSVCTFSRGLVVLVVWLVALGLFLDHFEFGRLWVVLSAAGALVYLLAFL